MGTKNGFVVELEMPAFHGMWLRFRPTTPPEALPSTRLTPFRESSDFHDDGAEARTRLDAEGILVHLRLGLISTSLDGSSIKGSPRNRIRNEEILHKSRDLWSLRILHWIFLSSGVLQEPRGREERRLWADLRFLGPGFLLRMTAKTPRTFSKTRLCPLANRPAPVPGKHLIMMLDSSSTSQMIS